MVKVIHYCWFGGAPLPKDTKKFMKSWVKFFPGYEIKRWDESNFDVNSVPFVAEAYAAKKWSFVSDYVRTYALYHEGGLYVDTDVKFIKGIGDLLQTSFLGFERPNIVNPGLIAYAERPKMEFFGEVLRKFDGMTFTLEKMEEVAGPVVYTEVLSERGLKKDNTLQKIGEITIYPCEYFQPIGEDWKLRKTRNTRSIHYYHASWRNADEQEINRLLVRFGPFWGKAFYTVRHPARALGRFRNSARRKAKQKAKADDAKKAARGEKK